MEEIKYYELKLDKVETLKAERAIVHYISTDDLDRGGDIVSPKGMDDKDFAKSPAVWYNHEYMWNPHALPVAKSLWRKKEDHGVLTKSQFATTEFADDVYTLHNEGVMNTWSIGWRVNRTKQNPITFDSEKGITHINHWFLIEYSSAPIAMNPNALDQLKSFGVKSQEFKSIITKADAEVKIQDVLKEYEDKIKNIIELESRLKTLIESYPSQESLDSIEAKILDLEQMIENSKMQITQEIKQTKPVEIVVKNPDLDKILMKGVNGAISRVTGRKL